MAYDSIHNITQKTQGHQVVTPGGAIVPQKKTSYAHAYKFSGPQPHAPTQIGDYKYFYDKNGNQTGWDDLKSGQKRVISWDEENRIQAISDNGHKTEFKYNDAGERVIKRGEQGETAYVNQFWTVRNRSVGTKHVFVGETRVSSKVIPGDDHVNPGNDKWAGVLGQWWLHRSAQGWANGKNTVKNPHYAGNAMPDNLPEDNFVFFYHPDHLGSTEYVTDYTGELYEHVQYFAFGETWVSEHKNTETLPYLFTSKELDEETGLYYVSARYYDPRTSAWQSADPALLAPARDIGSSIALSAYAYAGQNPLRFVDPSGTTIMLAARLTAAERQRVVSTMQRFSRDRLEARATRSGAFEVRIAAQGKGKELPAGTGLLRDLVKSKYTATIDVVRAGEEQSIFHEARTTPVGKYQRDAAVMWDVNAREQVFEKVPGSGYTTIAEVPDFIGLAHELVHAHDITSGQTFAGGEVQREFADPRGRSLIESITPREISTVGLGATRRGAGKYSENMLRREQGVRERAAYAPRADPSLRQKSEGP